MPLPVLISEQQIVERIAAMAETIAQVKPDIMIPILVGSFIFAADLLRALAQQDIALPIEFLWLRSYGNGRTGQGVTTLVGPSDNLNGKHVLLIDGVLDLGHTIAKAKDLLLAAGASKVTVAVMIDKTLEGAVAKADIAGFTGIRDFIAGYGMDDQQFHRGLPYIGKVE